MAQDVLPFKFIRMRDLPEITGISRPQLYVLISRGDFPAGTNLGNTKIIGFRSDLVLAWMENQPFVKTRKGGIAT